MLARTPGFRAGPHLGGARGADRLLRGAMTAEAQGQTLVANIVLKAGAGGSGTAQAALRPSPGGEATPKIELSYARR